MAVKLGNAAVAKLKLGNVTVLKVYLGSIVVWVAPVT
jgi:hypothetical protein